MYILTSSKNQQPRCISVFLAAIFFRCPSFSKYSRCKHESILSFDSTSLSSLLHTPIMDFPILTHDASKLIFVHMKHVSSPFDLSCSFPSHLWHLSSAFCPASAKGHGGTRSPIMLQMPTNLSSLAELKHPLVLDMTSSVISGAHTHSRTRIE